MVLAERSAAAGQNVWLTATTALVRVVVGLMVAVGLAACSNGHSTAGGGPGQTMVPARRSHPATSGAVGPTSAPSGSSTGPALGTTFLRSAHGALVGIARINMHQARLRLFGGTLDPGQGFDGQVPPAQRPVLLAAFNGGFKLNQSHGGIYLQGRTYRPLLAGAATVVVYRDGTAAVGLWGRDVSMSANVVAVRQNLTLLVDRSAPVAGLATNNAAFGATIHRRAAVSRSGLCTARDGTLVYAAGRDLTAADLADVLVTVGCVRGMELDINPQFVVFIAYHHAGPSLVGSRLVPTMNYGPARFLKPQTRDFFAVFDRH